MIKKPASPILWIASIAGAIVGYGLLHPYAMYTYGIFKEHGPMVAMGLPFALIGGAAGLLLGLWLSNKKKRIEAEKIVERLQKQLTDLKK